MSAAIFIRSFIKDYEFLFYCLRSIHKFASGFSEIIIAVPEGQQGPLSHLTAETVITVHDGQPGYLAQMDSKLHADLHTKSEFILHCDSDVYLTRPITPQTFMEGDKARWLMTPWSECHDARKAWFGVMATCLRECPTHDFMRRNTIMVPRWAYGAFREFIQQEHGVTLTHYVMNRPAHEFSEYDCLGFYLWLHHRDKIAWHDTSVMGVPPANEIQHWSYGGLTPEIRQEMEAALA